MSSSVNVIWQVVVWGLFFATSVYGHVAFKVAANQEAVSVTIWKMVFSLWGLTAIVAWGISTLLWLLILSKSDLLAANSISTLRYILLTLAAVFILNESISLSQSIGTLLIMVGVYFILQ